MSFVPKQDNVLLALEPLPTATAGGILYPGFEYKTTAPDANGPAKRDFDPRRKRSVLRRARVLAVGPGHYAGCNKCGGSKRTLIPTRLRPGDIVWIDAVAGDDWSLDKSAPRHHTRALNFEQVGDEVGELRVVREEECQLLETSEGDDCPETVRDCVDRLVPRWPCEDSGVDGGP